MKFQPTEIDGLWQVKIERHGDERGSFGRIYCRDEFAAHGLTHDFVQMSISRTRHTGTIRGMHWQMPPHAEAKLVRCGRGAIYDVVCDLRPRSATRLRHQSFQLSGDDDCMVYIPPGCAHGFQTLTDDVEIIYAMSHNFAPQAAAGLRFDDAALGIAWPLPATCVSERDLAWPPYSGETLAVL
jgi:dTDP-4-dehydrorhamnose 3,5-epimerase